MNRESLYRIQEAIREEGLDGWLFCNFRHRDIFSDSILQRSETLTNSRFWFYAVPASGQPLALVHAVEEDHLAGLPGTQKSYVSRDELLALLVPLAGKRWGAHISETIPALSCLDAGSAALLRGAGLTLVPAEALLQRFKGLLDEQGIASHEQASAELYGIVESVWNGILEAHAGKKTVREGDIRRIIEEEFEKRGLAGDHPPLVAAGAHSANPHYDFTGPGAPFAEGDIIQLDLWAKEKRAGSVYADISWVGVYGNEAPEAEKVFSDLVEVREKTYSYIESGLEQGRLSGAGVDARARALLSAGGYGKAIRHRTGHGIDSECHGSGVNIDSVEFVDTRFLLEGSCFSLEPGIYLDGFGLRTEINVYISGGKPRISGAAAGKERQFKLLSC